MHQDHIITAVDLHVLPMANSWTTQQRVSSPMSIYPEYAPTRNTWFGRLSGAFVQVILANGTQGFGLCGGLHGDAQALLFEAQLRDLVIGRSCLATGAIQDQLLAATQHYGRDGLIGGLISGIDIALWDAAGHLLEQPVSDLLGGTVSPTRTMPCYQTSYAPERDNDLGINNLKLAMPYGPADGEAGKALNAALVAQARDVIGDDGVLAIDCYMSWTIPYTMDIAQRCRNYRLAWIEEPLHPEDVQGYSTLVRQLGVLGVAVSAGEHSFTLRAFQALINHAHLPIIQPDIHRAGGPTALTRIAAIARSAGSQVMCHGNGLPTLHSMLAMGPQLAPLCEYLNVLQDERWPLHPEPLPHHGLIAIPSTPGFGYLWEPDTNHRTTLPVYG